MRIKEMSKLPQDVGRRHRRSYPLEAKLWLRRSIPFAVALATVAAMIWLTSSPNPVIELGPNGRFVVGAFAMVSFAGFAINAGMALGLYLLWRFGD